MCVSSFLVLILKLINLQATAATPSTPEVVRRQQLTAVSSVLEIHKSIAVQVLG
jgi:hypothetical protein